MLEVSRSCICPRNSADESDEALFVGLSRDLRVATLEKLLSCARLQSPTWPTIHVDECRHQGTVPYPLPYPAALADAHMSDTHTSWLPMMLSFEVKRIET
ncbi:unnamed protein product [Durusdinium trenchii]|uniref:Uncharacterized protein n=1 Tax=Durusdinium trenchii TaxID=1381693 RepID=A0ABP0KB95_9DINO